MRTWQNRKKATVTLNSLLTTVNASLHLHSASSKDEKSVTLHQPAFTGPYFPAICPCPQHEAVNLFTVEHSIYIYLQMLGKFSVFIPVV